MGYVDISRIAGVSSVPRDSLLDIPERAACAARVVSANNAFLLKVQELFRKELDLSPKKFQLAWNQAFAAKNITWAKDEPLPGELFHRIGRALRETVQYAGPGVQAEPKPGELPHVHGIVRYLLGKGDFSKEWLTSENGKAVFIQKDPKLLLCMQGELRSALAECGKCLPRAGSREETVFQAFVGNILALLPFSYPEEGAQFAIPQKVDGRWKMCRYAIDRRIDLTPGKLITPIVAYGLTSKEGPPLLTISGTTYPTGDGFLATVLSDFTPGMSVGQAPYQLGKEKIARWLEGKPKAHLFGTSLGGALCFHVLRGMRERVESVDVYNPAGLYPWNWDRPFDEERVRIYYQENDLVSSMGFFPEGKGVSVYRVYGPEKENFLAAHARAYSGSEEVLFLKSSPEYENSRISRKLLTALHFIAGILIGLIPLLFLGLAYLLYRKKA